LLDGELSVFDETAFGDQLAEMCLSFDAVKVSVREIISERVRDEVTRLKARGAGGRDIDHLLMKYGVEIDVSAAIEKALAGFESNQFIVLLDNTQVESLDQMVDLQKTQAASFVKLTPLAGG